MDRTCGLQVASRGACGTSLASVRRLVAWAVLDRGARSLSRPLIRQDAAGGQRLEASWTAHWPSGTLGGLIELRRRSAIPWTGRV